jgi:uncharacterized protein (UPF0261 family)
MPDSLTPGPNIAVLVTLDSKDAAARFICEVLRGLGAEPWLVDPSLRPHDIAGADLGGGELAELSGTSWDAMAGMERSGAAETMIIGATRALLDKYEAGGIDGVIGIGGANGSTVFCAMMRALPPLFPKVMVTPVAATAAVQWYVAESDIAMFPTIGDIVLNRVTRAVMENAAHAVVGMAEAHRARAGRDDDSPPLVGVSSFGNLQKCVDRVTDRLEAEGFEVMHFHASGPGGKALENLAGRGLLVGVIDITTSELTDLLTGGVYSAGDGRLKSAGAAGLPQVVAPGAIDHTNWWVGECPERYRDREFYQYNVEILLMRTNEREMSALGELFAERLNAATGPVTVMIPTQGFSQHVIRKTQDIDGNVVGEWRQPETDRRFTEAVRAKLSHGAVKEFDLHINDDAFADACVDEFLSMMARQ